MLYYNMMKNKSLKGKRLEGKRLEKLLLNNQHLKERYKTDPAYREKFFKEMVCLNCGKTTRKYKANANGFCKASCKWEYIKTHNPIRWKARSLSANLIAGIGKGYRGKIDAIESLIRQRLGRECGYCDAKLTLENISVDHKTPYGSGGARRNKADSVEERLQLDALTNIQLICGKCNRLKGNLTDDEFSSLLSFLSSNPSMRTKILKRLGAGHMYAYASVRHTRGK